MERLNSTLEKISPIDSSLLEETQKRLDNLTKPLGSLGKLENIAKEVVAITGKRNPILKDKVIITMAADHGVAAEGVSAYPQEVTPQMVYNFLSGGAGINVLAKHAGARVVVVDMGVAVDLTPDPKLIVRKIGYGTQSIKNGPAMSREQAIQAIEAGIEIVESEQKKGMDIVGTGDMGIANTTPSTAIVATITGAPVADVTGRGTGISDESLSNKIKVIETALAINNPDKTNPVDVLAKVGGFEIGGLAGVILGAAAQKIPVVVDGFISTAAALIATELVPDVKNYLFFAHNSVEVGHRLTLKHIGKEPLLDLHLRLGEGTGAALAMHIIEGGVKILNEMASFEEAGVAEKTRKN